MPSLVGEHRMADVRVHDDVAHAVHDAGVHEQEPISLEVDARSLRSSIIAAIFRVNARPNAKPNSDASSRDGSCNGFSSSRLLLERYDHAGRDACTSVRRRRRCRRRYFAMREAHAGAGERRPRHAPYHMGTHVRRSQQRRSTSMRLSRTPGSDRPFTNRFRSGCGERS